VSAQGGLIMRRLPRLRAWLWRVGYDVLASRFQTPGWIFMNYGFAHVDGSPNLAVLDPEHQRFERSVELYRQAIGEVEIAGRDVLEVGSGRGGGSWYVARYLKPRSITGVDYSRRAVELAQERFHESNLTFREGSADALPFADASFDVVVNVESSHCYPSMEKFLAEVVRVLRPGGAFCIADFRGVNDLLLLRQQLNASGLTLVEEIDITPNVRRSMDIGTKNKEMIAATVRPRVLQRPVRWFSGVEGTGIYEALHDGRDAYTRWVLQKTS
jgi:ubiquinone/menaquinone biosynthesis C-methylase UbiE